MPAYLDMTSNLHENPHYRLLVVDDDQRLRNLLFRYLSEHQFDVTTAENAKIARSILKKERFDLVILDVMMPGENGFDLTKYIQKEEDTPVLLLSARGDTEAKNLGFDAGAHDYLSKPFEPVDLLLRIQSIIERS